MLGASPSQPIYSPSNQVKEERSVRSTTALYNAASVSISPAEPEEPKKASSIAAATIKKIIPLGAMLFFILFNYTILRDTKDVLVVTAPNSGAEIIPFLKTYVNLPSAIGFTVMYSQLCNKMSSDKVFFIIMTAFLSFFGAFAGIIYPNRMFLHPNAAADWLSIGKQYSGLCRPKLTDTLQ